MSLFAGQEPATAGTDTSFSPRSHASDNPMTGGPPPATSMVQQPQLVDPHTDARTIVRLIQCSQCSLPLQNPLTLPCGGSLCRNCLPELHPRENISYPQGAGRQNGFVCPFPKCKSSHALGDCSQDVCLSKLLEKVSIEVARSRPLAVNTPTLLDERPHWKNVVDSSKDESVPASRILNGGRLLATYTLAELGELRYDSEVAYQTMSPTLKTYEELDCAMLDRLKEATKVELDCQVCYALMLDPLTTSCGHTFCRKCVARVQDHSTSCPICRRALGLPIGLQKVPGNQRLSKLLSTLCPDLLAARADAAAQEEASMTGEKNVPFFVCTLAYPSMPTFLHVFEPRYRLMTRRAVESGDRKFGMLMYNERREPQGDMGITQFMQYGTMLHINTMQLMPDGRSLIENRGVSRFRVKSWGMRDGYIVGEVERIDDVSLAEEEAMEARERALPPAAANDIDAQLDRMPTVELLRIGTNFINRMRAASAPWLHSTYVANYGEMPDDPALFPYWFASVLPISDDEKYRLLPTTSVRERLKITAKWVKKIEAQRCSLPQSLVLDQGLILSHEGNLYSGDEGEHGDDDSTPASPTQSETAVAEDDAGTSQQEDAAIPHATAMSPPPASPPADDAGQSQHEASPQREERNTD